MEEQRKIEVAVFRYGVIQDFVNGIRLDHGERERLLREKCTRKWQIPYSFKAVSAGVPFSGGYSFMNQGASELSRYIPKAGTTKALFGF